MDIEFIAQILLLRFGRKHRQLRLSTRKVIQQLRERELIPAEEGVSVLAHDDRFREVEKGCG